MQLMEGRRGHWIAGVILVLVPLIFLWDMVVRGEEPLAPDTQAARPFTLWATEASKQLGEMPLWCPSIFAGMPSYGSFIYMPPGALDPLQALRKLVGRTRGLRYFLGYLIGGLGLYGLLRIRELAALPALGGALVYILSPYLVGLIAAGHSTKLQALMLVPLVFLAIERLLQRRDLLATGLLAAAVALQFWRNHPQISYYTLLLAGLYVGGRLIFERPARWRGRGLLMGLVLGLLALFLAAGLIMEPYAAVQEYTPHSIRGEASALEDATGGQSDADWDYATSWSFSPRELISFLFPAWFGLEGQTYWGMMPFTQSTHYIGITVLALAVLGLCLTRGRERWLWMGMAFILLVIGFGRHFALLYRPMYNWLPLFSSFRIPSMIYAMLPLPAALLVGAGLQAVLRDEGWRDRPTRWKRWPAITIGLIVVLLIWLIAGGAIVTQLRAAGAFVSAREAAQLGPEGLSSLKTLAAERLRPGNDFLGVITERISMLRSSVALGLFLLSAVALFIEGRRRGLLRGELAAGLLLVCVVGDLWVVGRKFYHPRPRRYAEASLAPDEAVRFLQRQTPPFRIAPLTAADQHSNRFVAFGLESLSGYQPAKLRIYDDLIRSGQWLTLPVMGMLNARYILADERYDGLPLAAEVRNRAGGTTYILENPQLLPRAWFVRELRISPNAETFFSIVETDAFQPAEIAWVDRAERPALLADLFGGTDAAELESAGRLSGGEVATLEITPHRITAEVACAGPGPGLLVFSEIYYAPGWKLTIDSEPARIHRVNHVLRAVAVAPGEHAIEMRAVSPGRTRGILFSRISGVLVLALCVGGWWRGRRSGAV